MMYKERKYTVTYKGETYHTRLELHDSPAFEYGNKTMVLYYDGVNKRPQMYDTRYTYGVVENFEKWADDFIKTLVDDECDVAVEQ